jgi:hypothetical protein
MSYDGTPSKFTDLGTLFQDIYSDTLFVARQEALMPGLVTNVTGVGAATRYIPIYSSITAAAVSEGGTPTAQQLTKGTADTISPSFVRTKVGLTDQRIETDPDNGRAHVAQEAGRAIAVKIDSDLVGEFANFTQDFGAAGSALTLNRCAAAIAYMQAQSAVGMPSAVLHPYSWYAIWKEMTANGVTTRTGNPSDALNAAMTRYLVSDFQGATWYIDNNIGTGTAAVNAVFSREAIVLDTRKSIEQEEVRDANIAGYYIYHNVWYGTGTQRATFGAKLTATASVPSSF